MHSASRARVWVQVSTARTHLQQLQGDLLSLHGLTAAKGTVAHACTTQRHFVSYMMAHRARTAALSSSKFFGTQNTEICSTVCLLVSLSYAPALSRAIISAKKVVLIMAGDWGLCKPKQQARSIH